MLRHSCIFASVLICILAALAALTWRRGQLSKEREAFSTETVTIPPSARAVTVPPSAKAVTVASSEKAVAIPSVSPAPVVHNGSHYTSDHEKKGNTQTLTFLPLTSTQVQQVEKFLFFTGYSRSGHSIVGSFLDAHPNIILSYSFFLFSGLLKDPSHKDSIEHLLHNKSMLFNEIYRKSVKYAKVSSTRGRKGYTLDVPGLWSGTFDKQLKIIGDKSALPATTGYCKTSHSWFKKRYDYLQESVGIPLIGLHVVRNPFDMIATRVLYKAFDISWKSENWTIAEKYKNEPLLKKSIEFYFPKAQAVQEMIPLCDMNVLEVHSEDLVKSPREELERLCKFLEVECSEQYLDTCEKKTYRTVSRTRDLIAWPPDLKAFIEEQMKKYSFFRGYTFEDDFYNP